MTTVNAARRKHGSDMQDVPLWVDIQAQLLELARLQGQSASTLKSANTLQVALQNESEPMGILKPKLERAYDVIKREASDEEVAIQRALETLSRLISVRETMDVPADRKKRRRIDSPSLSDISLQTPNTARDSSPNRASPTGSIASHGSGSKVNAISPTTTTTGRSSVPPAKTVPIPKPILPALGKSSSAGSMSASKEVPLTPTSSSQGKGSLGRKSKIPFMSQLPLQAGRQVAFKQPPKPGHKSSKSNEDHHWILARVVRCINGDKSRYEVQDVDDEPGKAPALYITTIKSIIPLPDPNKRDSYPDQEYQSGLDVLAMYPDTTTFYQGKVHAPPAAPPSAGGKKEGTKRDREAARSYKIAFDEDEEPFQLVPPEFVAEAPTFNLKD